MRFLIDENLTPRLVAVANAAGYEAYHVAHRGWSGLSDEALFDKVLEAGFVFVTNNWSDFRPLAAGVELHPGLIVILENAPRAEEIGYFHAALALIQRGMRVHSDMVNAVIEVDGQGQAARYVLPRLD